MIVKFDKGSSRTGRHFARCLVCTHLTFGPAGQGGRTSRVSRLAKRHAELTGHVVEIQSTLYRSWGPA